MTPQRTVILALLVGTCVIMLRLIKKALVQKKYSKEQRVLQILLFCTLFSFIINIWKSLHQLYSHPDQLAFESVGNLLLIFPENLLFSTMFLSLHILLCSTELNKPANQTLLKFLLVYSGIRFLPLIFIQMRFRDQFVAQLLFQELLMASESVFMAIMFIKIFKKAAQSVRELYSTFVTERFLVESIVNRVQWLCSYIAACCFASASYRIIALFCLMTQESPNMLLASDIASFIYLISHIFLFYAINEVAFIRQRDKESFRKHMRQIKEKFFRYKFGEYLIMLDKDDSSSFGNEETTSESTGQDV